MDLFQKKRLAADYKKAFGTPEGERVKMSLVRLFHGLRNTYGENDRDSAYNQGQASVVIHILRTLNTDEKALERLLNESSKNPYDN